MQGRATATAKKVLCVDDNETLLLLTQMALEHAGYRVITESDGVAALRSFASERVDAVVLDYEMPGMDGAEVAARMARFNPLIPRVLFSACPEVAAHAEGVIDAFVTKDGNFRLLVAMLDKLLAREHETALLRPA